MSFGKKIRDCLFGVKYYEGIRYDEIVRVEVPHYDSKYTHEVVWEDVYNLYHLALNPNEDNIKKLQDKYEMRDTGSRINVKLRTPNYDGCWSNYDDSSNYSTFSLDEVKDFYKQVLDQKIRKEEQVIREKKYKEEELIRNEAEELIKSIEKIMKK